MTTRRDFLRLTGRVGADAVLATAAALPAIAVEPDPLPSLVEQWEPRFRRAWQREAALSAAVKEMEAAGFDDAYPWIYFGRTIWRTEAEIEAYYAPMIAKGVVRAEECRDKYLARLRDKLAMRQRLGIAGLEVASMEAWEAADEVEKSLSDAEARSVDGLVAKARYALLRTLAPDELEEGPDTWPCGATALASLIEDLKRLRPATS